MKYPSLWARCGRCVPFYKPQRDLHESGGNAVLGRLWLKKAPLHLAEEILSLRREPASHLSGHGAKPLALPNTTFRAEARTHFKTEGKRRSPRATPGTIMKMNKPGSRPCEVCYFVAQIDFGRTATPASDASTFRSGITRKST